MPRRKENHVDDHRTRGRRGPSRADIRLERLARQINKASAPASHAAADSTELTRNRFTRHVTGFSRQALHLMIGAGLDIDIREGFVAVHFAGISKAAKTEITYKKPSVAKGRDGIVALTGQVDAPFIDEIGHGQANIQRLDEPDLPGYDGAKRLNVGIGKTSENLIGHKLGAALESGGPLILSAVATVNGHQVTRGVWAEDLWR